MIIIAFTCKEKENLPMKQMTRLYDEQKQRKKDKNCI